MIELTTDPRTELIEIFKEMRNFDHPDMDQVAQIGQRYGFSPLESAKAFFVAREYASLEEVEKLDGGSGEIIQKVTLFGKDSLYEMLFGKKRKKSVR